MGKDEQTGSQSVSRSAGTPWFLSPEVVEPTEAESKESEENESKTKDELGNWEFKVDVWALGICLHAFVFGTLPFFHEDISELYNLIVTKNLAVDF